MTGLRQSLKALLLATALVVPMGALAQDKAATLADIRAQLGQLAAEFNALKNELVTTGAAARVGGGDVLQRMDAIEAELMRVTARAEEVELKLNRVVADGTNRLGDIEFRLCELTEGCDPLSLGQTSVLGGASAPAATTPPAASSSASSGASASNGIELAVSEKADFDRAQEVLGQGDFQRAADLFATYAQSYPGGPLIQEALFRRGEALEKLGQHTEAGRAYLESYGSNTKGTRASEALLKLGEMLGRIGETVHACITYDEVGIEFPGSSAAATASSARMALACP